MTTATQCAGLATLLALTTASPSFAQTRTTMPNGYPSHYCPSTARVVGWPRGGQWYAKSVSNVLARA
jgi:hypothetical protein